jgi:hypothetical protein
MSSREEVHPVIIANLITLNQDKPTRWGESKLGSPFVGESPSPDNS